MSAPGAVIWIVGPPASGKTTLATALLEVLRAAGHVVLWLDSDDLRDYLTPAGGYGEEGRDHFYKAIGHLAKLCVSGGGIALVSATASRRRYRDEVRAAVGRFCEIYITTPPAVREQRDPKGLYAKARTGKLTNLPGFDAPFEDPPDPELLLDGTAPREELVREACRAIREKLGLPV